MMNKEQKQSEDVMFQPYLNFYIYIELSSLLTTIKLSICKPLNRKVEW